MKKKSRNNTIKIEELYKEYLTFILKGQTHTETMTHFETYLHPITLAQLKAKIKALAE